MYRLRDLKNGLFQIHKTKAGAFEGPARPILEQAVKWGVKEQDLAYAVQRLTTGEGNYADFNANGTFQNIYIDSRKK